MTQSISIVFPMHNEKDYIARAVSSALSVISNITDDYEIVVVDDASTDGSGQIAKTLSDKNRYIKVVHHKKNRKLGGSLKSGFALASKELVLYSDMDLPFNLDEIKKAVKILNEQKADLVCAYRLNLFAEGVRRYLYHIFYNLFIRIIFQIKIKDVNFSFKLIKKDTLKNLKLFSEGSFIDAEILIKTKRLGGKVVEFGTLYFPRLHGSSKLSSGSVIAGILKESLSFRINSSLGQNIGK